jgi:hypothetical protein
MRPLTPEEAEAFRQDYLEKDKETQRYINVYIAGLALVTGWIIGPDSKPLLLMALGNAGYNVYALLFIVVVNVMFICFLVYKSLFIHEIMQFVAVLSERESGFVYWESWRRSKFSLTGRKRRFEPLSIRNTYTVILAVLPTTVSVMVLYHIWRLLSRGASPGERALPPAARLLSLYDTAKIWFIIVCCAHIVPLWFFFVNWLSANRMWEEIRKSHTADDFFDEPNLAAVKDTVAPSSPKGTVVRIVSTRRLNPDALPLGESGHLQS